MEKIININFNHQILDIKKLDYGTTLIISKLGYKKFCIEITKHGGALDCPMFVYSLKKDKNNNIIKYNNKYHRSGFIKNDVVINKDFLKNKLEIVLYISHYMDLIKYIR